jgi:integrase
LLARRLLSQAITLIETEEGGPMKRESLGNWFREICDAAGCPGSAHGLRKRAATRLAKAGANFVQLRAYFGWTTDRMPSLYTQAVEREEAALAAAAKVGASDAIIPLFDDEE